MRKEQLHLVDAQKEYFIQLDEILFCTASGNYCDIYMVQHTVYKTENRRKGKDDRTPSGKNRSFIHHQHEVHTICES